MLRKTLFLVILAMAISIAMNSSAQKASEMRKSPGSPLVGVPPAERLEVEVNSINILFVVALDFPYWDAIYNEFSALPEVGVCDRFNSQTGTPTVVQLQGYDVVIVCAEYPHANPDALGNNLADYVDSGGKVIALTSSRVEPWHIGGRFRTDGYDPFIMAGDVRNWDSVTLGGSIAHDIMNTPYLITGLWGGYRELSPLDPSAELVAWWSDDQPLVATKNGVVGMTIFPCYERGFLWDGQLPELLANACVWLVGGAPPPTSAIEGKVKNAVTGDPISKAKVIAINLTTKERFSVETDANGYYKIPDLASATYIVTCFKRGYKLALKIAKVETGKVTTVDFMLNPKPSEEE